MNINSNLVKMVSFAAIFMLLLGCSDGTVKSATGATDTKLLTVYKRAQCGCCEQWIKHVNDNGFNTEVHDHENLSAIKDKYAIPANLQSCHTTVTTDGFVFEGHIPAKFIQQFIDDKPEGAIGLTVPSMPAGSPGMEYNDIFQPYNIYLLNRDGSVTIYAKVSSPEEQI